MILVIAGLVSTINVITDPDWWSNFCILFQQYVEEGKFMDTDDHTALDTIMQDLRAYVIWNTSVLIPMANNSASGLYS